MSASTPSGGREGTENELLAQLGLPPSASPEDVDQLHLAVSQYLAAAPSSIKGWAHAQAAQLDEAYLSLTDPVGLEGSALRSPTRPPTVVPGGPATPPARRDPIPTAATGALAVEAADAVASPTTASPDSEDEPAAFVDDTDTDDEDALYASVTPGAHRDLTSGGKAPKPNTLAESAPRANTLNTSTGTRKHTRAAKKAAAPVVAPAPANNGPWKVLSIITSAGLLVVLIGFVIVPFVFNLGSTTASTGTANNPTAAPSASGPVVDMARVAGLMAQLQAAPNDVATLQAIGDEYFKGNDFANAITFYGKAVAADPKNVPALLALGASYYNSGDDSNAEKTWQQVVALNPTDKNQAQEVHYDLGFLYLNSATPNWSGVQSEWKKVIAIDATTQIAQVVQQHLDSLIKASMIPGASGAAPSGSAAPAASGAPAPSASAGASSAPAASTSPAPSGSTAP